jgi:hypothetical protein
VITEDVEFLNPLKMVLIASTSFLYVELELKPGGVMARMTHPTLLHGRPACPEEPVGSTTMLSQLDTLEDVEIEAMGLMAFTPGETIVTMLFTLLSG